MQSRTAVGIAMIALVVSLFANLGFAKAIHANCVAAQRLNNYVYEAANRALITLPEIDYYKSHPAELEEQLKRVREQRDFFTPKKCYRIPLPWRTR